MSSFPRWTSEQIGDLTTNLARANGFVILSHLFCGFASRANAGYIISALKPLLRVFHKVSATVFAKLRISC